MKRRVVVAMSGGVDSSVAAALLVEAGYDVVGIAMRLAADQGHGGSGRCCSYEDFEDARRVAERMDFPFYVVDMRAEFGAGVIAPFVDEYLAGRTPNPCLLCNREIKFAALWERARALEADLVATGHYARVGRGAEGGFRLRRAADPQKDQSYFLFTLTQEQLSRTLFPLGEMNKSEVRRRARALGLRNADKPESQEICFVPGNDYASFVSAQAPSGALRPGPISDSSGRQLGRHDGIHRFTVGQRRGLGIAAGEPLYVREIEPVSGTVTVGRKAELASAGLSASAVTLVDESVWGESGGEHEVEVKIRYRHPPLRARLRLLEGGRAQVRFASESPAVTPGQACVFYRGDEVLGGGFIERALRD